MASISSMKANIKTLRNKLENEQLSQEERQIILDTISEYERSIEKMSRSEKLVIPTNAPTIKEKKRNNKKRFSIGEGSFTI